MRENGASIAIVDGQPVVVQEMAAAFLARTSFEVVATGGSADEARYIAERLRPDVILIDLGIGGDVFGTIQHIVEAKRTKVIVFTADASLDAARHALEAGALGFVLKGADFEELLNAVQYARNDELYIAREVATQVLMALRARKRPEALRAKRLSARENQIVDLLGSAKSNREIAQTLALSEKTVKRYMTGLMQKMHARNRADVVINARKGMDHGLAGQGAERG